MKYAMKFRFSLERAMQKWIEYSQFRVGPMFRSSLRRVTRNFYVFSYCRPTSYNSSSFTPP